VKYQVSIAKTVITVLEVELPNDPAELGAYLNDRKVLEEDVRTCYLQSRETEVYPPEYEVLSVVPISES
jgi:hypothetical protein